MTEEYKKMKEKLCRGWNTWNNKSVLSYVHLPEGFSVSLGIKDYRDGKHLNQILIGRFGEDDEKIVPSYHAYDASYTELTMSWRDCEYHIETAVEEDELVILVTPLKMNCVKYPILTVEASVCWNREGYVTGGEEALTGHFPENVIRVYHTGNCVTEPYTNCTSKYHAVELKEVVCISTGYPMTVEMAKERIEKNRQNLMEKMQNLESECGAEAAECYRAMQTCLAWDTIYDPQKDRVISPVSRIWSENSNGYVLFCWDTYFASLMAMMENKELAYSNAIEITHEKTENGFVPNFVYAYGFKSRDRSQPPVGSFCVRKIYEKYREQWFLWEVFDDLCQWNDWWFAYRQPEAGKFAWGSNPYQPVTGNFWERNHVGNLQGAAFESGLDNSPMYDEIGFDQEQGLMEMEEAGLTGLVLWDCKNLREIAEILGETQEAEKLTERIRIIEEKIQDFWDGETGFFLNLLPDGSFSPVKTPANFYPLFSGNITEEQIFRILQEHFYNEKEFWGEYMIPSVSKDHPAFEEQNYWRGRIWAPMNLLVCLALKEHPSCAKAAKDLAEKSKELLLKEWLECGHVHENYNGMTGEGCDVKNSDKYYHWGGLLGLAYLLETIN